VAAHAALVLTWVWTACTPFVNHAIPGRPGEEEERRRRTEKEKENGKKNQKKVPKKAIYGKNIFFDEFENIS
jgi:hypothetical protein